MKQSLLDKAADAVYKELERLGGDPRKLPRVVQPVAILYTIQAMIDNGGFRYVFESNFPINLPYSAFVDAYRQIGANDAAERLEQAAATFPFENPQEDPVARNNFMDSLDESHNIFVLGDLVCGDGRVWLLMQEYVRKHSDAFAQFTLQ